MTEDIPRDDVTAPTEQAREVSQIDPRMLEYLVCPVTRGPLVYDAGRQELISRGAHLAFPIHGGIPVMLIDEARRLDD
jgi:uncharacterized protein YbaR (Trm112 family)